MMTRGTGERRRQRTAVRAAKEAIAQLSEELAFSVAYVQLLVEEGYEDAALAVIDEQQRSLDETTRRLANALAARSRRRMRVAIAGVAAAMMVGSSALAALGPWRSPETPATSLGRAGQRLRTAVAAETPDPASLGDAVEEVRARVLDLVPADAGDPEVQRALTDIQDDLAGVRVPDGSDLERQAEEITAAIERVVEPLPERQPSASATPTTG